MKTVAFYTLGCKVNQYETEAISEIFVKEGYNVVDFHEKADVYVINTCTVTNLSDRKSRQMIRKARSGNENAVVAVVGCYAQTAPEEVGRIPGVNLILGTKDRGRIVDYIKEIEAGGSRMNVVDNIMGTRVFEDLKVDTYTERTRAFLKIQEGCSQFCSYCIIPYARGPIRSRLPGEVIDEVEKLAGEGFREIVLTGIHLASYGKDIGSTSLLDITGKIHDIKGIERIRLGSIEPTTLTEEFIKAAGDMDKLCPHYHVSLQSGCDATLKRMNRRYSTDEYFSAITALRGRIRDVSVTTDVMVGFPGETDEEFEQTYRFLEKVSFSRMHVFKYSPRKGTPAASFPNQVPPEKKEERSGRVLKLSGECERRFNSGLMGRVFPVLYEQELKHKAGFVEGLTPNYVRVTSPGSISMEGKISDTRLTGIEADGAIGEIIRL